MYKDALVSEVLKFQVSEAKRGTRVKRSKIFKNKTAKVYIHSHAIQNDHFHIQYISKYIDTAYNKALKESQPYFVSLSVTQST